MLESVLQQDPAGIAGDMTHLLFKVMIAALAALAVIAAADYVLQRQRFLQRNRMSKQEIKEEYRQSEGDPQIKARIRQVRQERAKKRMIAAVPDATVIITNPTHYAVALKYESGKMAAPVCVAKGVDALALRIREVAKENDVPIVENPPLARALHATVEVDEVIPAEHFKAVAQVIGYVMRLTGEDEIVTGTACRRAALHLAPGRRHAAGEHRLFEVDRAGGQGGVDGRGIERIASACSSEMKLTPFPYRAPAGAAASRASNAPRCISRT